MRKVLLLAVLFLTLSIALNPLPTNAAIADGIHNVSFQVNKPDSNSASMANDYFLKPAKLIVSNGSMKVQITIKNSSWVTEFKPPGGATVISTNATADQRVVQFNVSNLNTIKVAMKIDIDEIDYHHGYTVDFVFNSNGLPEKQATEETSSSSKATGGTSQNSSASNGSTSSESANSSHSQAISKKPSSQSNQSSQDSNDTNNQSSETDTLEEDTLNKEQNKSEVTGDISEVVENPETADAFPYIYVLLLFGSIMLLVKFKNTQKN